MKTKLSKALSLILAVVLTFGAIIPAFASDEIPEGYTPIYTAEDLNNIRNNLSGNYILMNDIDLSVYENWEPISLFKGVLDGNRFLIKGLNIEIEATESGKIYCGLIARAREATLKNLQIYDADVFAKCPNSNTAYIYGGILIGYEQDCTISDCAVSGNIRSENFSATYLGGLIGMRKTNFWVTMKRCSNYADVSAVTNSSAWEIAVGGVSGYSMGVDKEQVNYGKISLSGDNVNDGEFVYISAGGVIGNHIYSNRLYDSFNCGSVSVNFSTPNVSVGGLSGRSSKTYTSYNCGTVTAPEGFEGYIGALSGNAENSDGLGNIAYMENLYYLKTDLVPAYATNQHPDELTENEYNSVFNNVQELGERKMKSQSCFVGFDFDTVWTMEEDGYPVLQNQPILYGKESIELEKGKFYSANINSDWISSDENIATVDENGSIVAVGAGTTTITVTPAYNYYIEYTVSITDTTVTPDPDPDTDPEPDPEPDPKPDPEPSCLLLRIFNTIKKIWNFVVNTLKSIF